MLSRSKSIYLKQVLNSILNDNYKRKFKIADYDYVY